MKEIKIIYSLTLVWVQFNDDDACEYMDTQLSNASNNVSVHTKDHQPQIINITPGRRSQDILKEEMSKVWRSV